MFVKAQEDFGEESFTAKIGAEALKDVLSAIDLEQDRERLREDLGDVIDFVRERDTRIHTRLTTAEFRSLLREGAYDIIHFAGHGSFNANDPETSAWALSDGELWPWRFATR